MFKKFVDNTKVHMSLILLNCKPKSLAKAYFHIAFTKTACGCQCQNDNVAFSYSRTKIIKPHQLYLTILASDRQIPHLKT